MIYNIFFDIAAIMLTAMLLAIALIRRAYPTVGGKCYIAMLWLNLISSVTDLVSAYTISNPFSVPVVANYGVNMAFLLSHNFTAITFLMYVIYLVRGNMGTKGERFFYVSVGVLEIGAILSTPWTNLLIYFDENRAYCHGILMPLLYALAFSILIYSWILFIRNRRSLNKFQMTTNVVFLTFLIASVIFQYFFPKILIESFCGAISLLMLNIAMDNPALYFYGNTSCFNQTAFDTTVSKKLRKKEPFTIVAYTFDDISFFKKKFGSEAVKYLDKVTIAQCHEMFGRKNVYMLANNCMAILVASEQAEKVIDSISKSAGKDIPVQPDRKISLTPHFALLKYPGADETVEDINLTLDVMLYDIFDKTSNHVIDNDSKMLDVFRREERVAHRIRLAIENDGFETLYQPIYDPKEKRFISAEALARIKQNIDDEFIGPEEFICVAEKNGLILDVGEIIFDKAVRCWKEKDLASMGIRYLEVNLSMVQLMLPTMAKRYGAICEKYGVDPHFFNLEITETANATENERSIIAENIEELRRMGFTFSLDDYGFGYSTPTYMADMPVDIIKIEKKLLWNAMKKPLYRTVLDSIFDLAQSLGKKCVAEGVETEEMAELLNSLGCDYHQGYLYSRPLREKDLTAFLVEKQTLGFRQEIGKA